ncbi:MAG: hypothetical protein U0350_24630 [Caldilineaceae bacterium]
MSRTRRWLILVVILGVAIGLRLWRIDRVPPGFYFDESFEGLEAWRILTDPTYRPIFLTGNFGVDPLNSYANAGMFALFRRFGGEAGPVAMHVTAACFGVLAVLTLYGLAHELQRLEDKAKPKLSTAFPLLAMASLAVMRWHIHFSRMGIEPILTPLVWICATWLFLRGWRTGQWWAFAGSGFMLATAMYAYQAAWLIPFLMVPVAALLVWQQAQTMPWSGPGQRWQSFMAVLRSRQGLGLGVTVLVACLVFAPLAWFFWQNLDQLFLRPSQVVATGVPDAKTKESIGQTIFATLNMYNLWGATGDQSVRRNLPGEPVLNLWQALPFYLGLGLALWRIRRPAYGIILIGLVGLLLPGALSSHAPHFHRLLGASAPTALLCAVGLDAVWQWRPWGTELGAGGWGHGAGGGAQLLPWAAVLLVVLGGAASAYDYFGRWAVHPDLFNSFRAGLWQISQDFVALPPEQPVYITLSYYNYPTLEFAIATDQHPVQPITFDGRHILPVSAEGAPQPTLYVVTTDEGRYVQQLLPQLFPNLQLQKEIHDPHGDLYASYYSVPAHTTPQLAPQYSITATLGDGIRIRGYDLKPEEIFTGKTLYVRVHWLVNATPQADWTVVLYVLSKNATGELKEVATTTTRPGKDSLRTKRWQPGWLILDEYKVKLPKHLTPGEYYLRLELINPSEVHLPADGKGLDLGAIHVISK